MSDRDALLEAVFANPADDAPRLVYADWLEEHGEPAQAALIRAQVEQARLDPNTVEYDRLPSSCTACGTTFWPSFTRSPAAECSC